MKITKFSYDILDNYGRAWKHQVITKNFKTKKVTSETIGTINNPLYKRTFDGKTLKEFDMGLFGKWLRR